jgi:hypothetical protein
VGDLHLESPDYILCPSQAFSTVKHLQNGLSQEELRTGGLHTKLLQPDKIVGHWWSLGHLLILEGLGGKVLVDLVVAARAESLFLVGEQLTWRPLWSQAHLSLAWALIVLGTDGGWELA